MLQRILPPFGSKRPYHRAMACTLPNAKRPKLSSDSNPSNFSNSVLPVDDLAQSVAELLLTKDHVTLFAVSQRTADCFRFRLTWPRVLKPSREIPVEVVISACTSGPSTVKFLNLTGKTLASQHIRTLLGPTSLTHLNLSNTNIMVYSRLESLVRGLPGGSLRALRLGRNHLNDDAVARIASVLPDTKLVKLLLDGNSIRDAGAESLARVLSQTSITTLGLERNAIGDRGARSLSHILPDCLLDSLLLGNNYIGDTGTKALADLLSITSLTVLDLRGNKYGATATHALAQSLGGSSLEQLCVFSDRSCAEAALALAQEVQGSSLSRLWFYFPHLAEEDWNGSMARGLMRGSLARLDLSSNMIADFGARALAQFLAESSLTGLHLRLCYISDAGASALAASLPRSALRILDLSFNQIGDVGSEAFSAVLPRAPLRQLCLKFNEISDVGVAKLVSCDAGVCQCIATQQLFG